MPGLRARTPCQDSALGLHARTTPALQGEASSRNLDPRPLANDVGCVYIYIYIYIGLVGLVGLVGPVGLGRASQASGAVMFENCLYNVI